MVQESSANPQESELVEFGWSLATAVLSVVEACSGQQSNTAPRSLTDRLSDSVRKMTR